MATKGLRLRLKNVNVDKAKLVEPQSPAHDAVKRAAEAAVELARQFAPKRSGELAESIEYRFVETTPGQRIVADIGAGRGTGQNGATFVQVMKWVNLGTTGPIVSTTKGKKMVLQNTVGSPLYRTSVAGQQANPFLVKAIKQIRKQDFEQ